MLWKPTFVHAGLTALLIALLTIATSAQAQFDSHLFAGLSARSVGPAAVGGRIAAIDALASNPNHIVIGAATGGVWISDNGGLTWTPVFDDQPVASIGAVAINQTNPDVIWVGTGEGNVRNSTSVGGGVFKSIDGGKHWRLMGLAKTERINRIALDPANPDVAYVAALGTLWGENKDRGVYKTRDGGKTWRKILYVDERTGATDIKMDPSNPNKLYAALWQHRRWPYFFKSGGPGSGLYISYDAGASWKRKTEEDGLPKGELGRMVIALSPAAPKRVYALIEAKKSALLRSDDGGEHWQKVNETYNVADRPFYYSELAVDPKNPDRIYNIATRVRVSIDGGKHFELNPVIACCAASNTIHIDNHAFWINPNDPNNLIFGSDGGIAISHDQGATFRFVRNLPLAQFYHIAVDHDKPYHIYGGLQDNGSWRGPSAVWENAGIRNLHWQEVGFGDGFDTVPDHHHSSTGYTMSQGGYLLRWNLDNGEQRLIRPPSPSADVELRFNWNAGFALDPFDPKTIYYGSQFLHKSTDRGNTWSVISPDLTSNNPKVQTFHESGGLTADVTAAENYTSIVTIAPSLREKGLLWVGSDDGRVHVTRDGGAHWKRVDGNAHGVPAGAWVPMIAPSPHDAGTAFVVFDDHRRSNNNTYVYRVEDYGRHWRKLGDKNVSGYALSVLQDPVNADLLFLGTEFGLFFSTDAGKHWTKFTAGVPTVAVKDMAIQTRENDLVLGTHGRAAFVIDDYSALRGLSPADFKARLKFLSTSGGQQYDPNQTPSTRFTGSGEFRAQNEPYGVMLTFMASGDDLPNPDAEAERARAIAARGKATSTEDTDADDEKKKDHKPKVEITVHDAKGDLIRTFRHTLHQGINRIVWDMHRDGVRPAPGPKPPKLEDGLPAGPEVPPGIYRVTLSFDGHSDTREVNLLADPRSQYPQGARLKNYQAQLQLMKLRERAIGALERIVHARDDVSTIVKLIAKRPKANQDKTLKALKKQAGEVKKSLTKLEKRFRVPPESRGIPFAEDKVMSRIGMAMGYVGSTYDAPSATARVAISSAHKALDKALAELDQFAAGDLAAFREKVHAAGIGLLVGEATIVD